MSNDMEKRLQELEEKQGILEAIFAYGHTIDYGLKAEFADLFTENATYHVTLFGQTLPHIGVPQETGVGIKGRDAIRSYVDTHTQSPAMWHKHMTSNPLIRVNGDKATAETYFQRLDEDRRGAYIMTFGRYVDELVKGSDGKWRFAKRECQMESRMPVFSDDGQRL